MKIRLKKLIKRLNREETNPLITIRISAAALLHNLAQFQGIKPENKVMPVLKSNAYGHGLIEVASILENKVEFFVIDSYFEALALRNEGIKTALLIMGYVRPDVMNSGKLKNISYGITSFDTLYSISSPVKIHLKIDTGMHRQGIMPEELEKAFSYIKSNPTITLEGICSHFADADSVDKTYTEKQINLWNSIVNKAQKEFPSIKYVHISNSYGHSFANTIQANTSRLGIGLYGLADIEGLDLKPVLEMRTILTNIKKIAKGDSVGYNNSFVALYDMTIATVPVGYYEGIDRQLSNKGSIRIKGTDAPIVGKVSMNMTTVDVSAIKDLKIGDEVQVISPIKSDSNSIYSMAHLGETITYELVVKIPREIKRIII
ncbi:MAG: Alanine racemase [Patescibacteria group bacterium]|nr:Alanine racemase [Patescibacteria group bacterium]